MLLLGLFIAVIGQILIWFAGCHQSYSSSHSQSSHSRVGSRPRKANGVLKCGFSVASVSLCFSPSRIDHKLITITFSLDHNHFSNWFQVMCKISQRLHQCNECHVCLSFFFILLVDSQFLLIHTPPEMFWSTIICLWVHFDVLTNVSHSLCFWVS